MKDNPGVEYEKRLQELTLLFERLEKREQYFVWARLGCGALFAVISVAVFGAGGLAPFWLATPLLLLIPLIVLHDRLRVRINQSNRAVGFYKQGLARIQDRWHGMGTAGLEFRDAEHLYSADLDLFGESSLFQLLSTCRTRWGNRRLAEWLCNPADVDTILRRQDAVTELSTRFELRRDLALLGEELEEGIHPDALGEWALGPPVLADGTGRIVSAALVAATLATTAGWSVGLLSFWPLVALLLTEAVVGLFYFSRVRRVVESVEQPHRELQLVSQLLARFEGETFTSPLLKDLAVSVQTEGRAASVQTARLARLVTLLDNRRNQFFRPFSYGLMWSTQLAFALESWRSSSGSQIPTWLSALSDFEALCSLATYSYEHPEDPFPEFTQKGPLFEGHGLGHPLLPRLSCVVNDIRLDNERSLIVVSGSNMSGKTTLLRTVGINALMAQAGAPVRASQLRLSVLQLGATLRVQDSLQEGRSRFLAEIMRIRQVFDLTAGEIPVLFLLDEILHGTNSHDRLIGAEGIMRALIKRGAIGLITTHDLALTRVADTLSPRGVNLHFEDHLEDGKMVFDYELRPGVVTKSNALELMRSVGLQVAEPDPSEKT